MNRRKARDNLQTGRWYTLVILTLILILFVLVGICIGVYRYRSQFSPEKWRNAPGRRAFIVSDFLNDHPPVGLTEDEIRELLGEPDTERTEEGLELGYVLGNVRTVLDAEWLMLDFEDGVVREYYIDTGVE